MYTYMDIKKLAMVHEGAKPLYYLNTGARYKYVDSYNNDETHTFIKHSEYEFPAHFRLNKKNMVTYQYKVSIPDSHGHQVVFVDDTAIVKVLEFL